MPAKIIRKKKQKKAIPWLNESLSEYQNYIETLDEHNIEIKKEQHNYEGHTSVSENKTVETTITNADSDQYVNFEEQLRKELGTLCTSLSRI